MDSHSRVKRESLTVWRVTQTRAVLAMLCALFVGVALPVEAQFNSGSSGTHGVFPPVPESGSVPAAWGYIVWNVRTGGVRYCTTYTMGSGSDQCGAGTNVFAQIPNIPQGGLTTGVYEFTEVNIPAFSGIHRTVVIVGSSPNVPLSILAQGDISLPGNASGYLTSIFVGGVDAISSSSNFSVTGAAGGPGGFPGGSSGNGGATPGAGSAGFGPAGGAGGRTDALTTDDFSGAHAAPPALNPSLTPLGGGSGGGGAAGVGANHPLGCGSSALGYGGGGGGGGGGALLLAASGRVTLGPTVNIDAAGGWGARNNSSNCGLYGGGGAGGSVRIVAREFVGSGAINVGGGSRVTGANTAPGGQVRIEAALNTFTGSINGAAGGSFLSFPTASVPANQPVLRISSLGGAAVPASPSASLVAPDITFPSAIDAPVTLGVAASNVPVGTAVSIRVVPATGQPTTATSGGLAGTLASSTAQATVTLPPGAGIVTASATFALGGSGAGATLRSLPLIDGNRPERVEVAVLADGTSHTYLIGGTGARFEVGPTSHHP